MLHAESPKSGTCTQRDDMFKGGEEWYHLQIATDRHDPIRQSRPSMLFLSISKFKSTLDAKIKVKRTIVTSSFRLFQIVAGPGIVGRLICAPVAGAGIPWPMGPSRSTPITLLLLSPESRTRFEKYLRATLLSLLTFPTSSFFLPSSSTPWASETLRRCAGMRRTLRTSEEMRSAFEWV